MAYLPIQTATKTAAVKHFWRTGNLRATALKFGVSRNAIYDWVRIAEQHLETAFLASTPGKRTATLEEQNQKLQTQLDEVLDVYHKISHRSTRRLAAVARCPGGCQSATLIRNGRVRSKRDGVQQRLWCRACRVSVYVDVKKIL
jgi:transposase-like protein